MNTQRETDWNRNSGVDTFANVAVIGAGLLVIVLGSLTTGLDDVHRVGQVAQRSVDARGA